MKKTLFAVVSAILLLGIAGYAGKVGSYGLNFIAPSVTDKDAVYSPQVGEIVFDSTDSQFYGYDQAGNWLTMTQSAGSSVPTGTILSFASSSAPNGYLIADGSSVSRTTYAALFAVIGTSFGQGDGSTTFNLPDLRGRFLRGVDDGAGRDPDASSRTAMATGGNTGDAVGSVQGDEYLSHTHTQDSNFRSPSLTATNLGLVDGASTTQYTQMTVNGKNTGAAGGNETRPKNAYVNFIIKY